MGCGTEQLPWPLKFPNVSSVSDVNSTETKFGFSTFTVYSTSPPVSGTVVGLAVLMTLILNCVFVNVHVMVSPGSNSKSAIISVSCTELTQE